VVANPQVSRQRIPIANHGGMRISIAMITFRPESVLKGGLSVENRAVKFTILMDEPETLRGTDTGLNPVEMML
jgi:hypothetical protein